MGTETRGEEDGHLRAGLALTFSTKSLTPGAASTRWTDIHDREMDVQGEVAHWAFLALVDDICGKYSALVTKRNDGHHSHKTNTCWHKAIHER